MTGLTALQSYSRRASGGLRSSVLPPLLCLLAVASSVVADDLPLGTTSDDPYLDPKNDLKNPLRYITSNTLSGIAIGIVLLIAIAQTFCVYKWGAKYMLAMVIGGYTFAAGFGLRFPLHSNPRSIGIYIAEDMFVLLSPCAFIAACYVLLGRLATFLDSADFVPIRPTKITKFFVLSDLTTFLIQASGGGLSAASGKTNPNMAKVGSKIVLVGMILQLASFGLFFLIYLRLLFKVKTQRQETWRMDSNQRWSNDWRATAYALVVSCIGIFIRCTFRTVELSEGYSGYLTTHEPYFYLLDTLPLVIATAILIPFWPGRVLQHGHSVVERKEGMKMANMRQDADSHSGLVANGRV